MQSAGDDQSVPSVVARSDQQADRAGRKVGQNGAGRVLHEDQGGESILLDGRAIDGFHLARGHQVHGVPFLPRGVGDLGGFRVGLELPWRP
jgi:hypothetical protein